MHRVESDSKDGWVLDSWHIFALDVDGKVLFTSLLSVVKMVAVDFSGEISRLRSLKPVSKLVKVGIDLMTDFVNISPRVEYLTVISI